MGNLLQNTDTQGTASGVLERPTVPVKLTLKATGAGGATQSTDVNQNIQFISPADVIGIKTANIVRTDPVNLCADFEANYLPFIEFYDTDFLWRYTPFTANTSNISQLRPWLALLVLADGVEGVGAEYTASVPDSTHPLPYITLQSPTSPAPPAQAILPTAQELPNIFHPANEHWAWAHVHLFQDVGNAALPAQQAISNIIADPDNAVCRLLCPRKLSLGTSYTAFLLPAFETGRLAGLGADEAVVSAVDIQTASWSTTGPQSTMPFQFPVYYQWSFATSQLGDFEALVQKLQPQVMPDTLGTRDMDIKNTGYNLLPDTETVGLEGALVPPGFTPAPAIGASTLANDVKYATGLLNILNLNDDLQKSFTSQSQRTGINGMFGQSLFYDASNLIDDPIITPPIYGQWHAMVNRVSATGNRWVDELNRDPRYRAVAGLGSQVFKNDSERYLNIAWQQIGEVNALNQKIAAATLAQHASDAMYTKHFSATACGPDSFVASTAALYKRVKSGSASVFNNVKATQLPTATLDSGFRKMTRNNLRVVKLVNANQAAVNGGQAAKLSSVVVTKLGSYNPLFTVATPKSCPFTALPASSNISNLPTGLPNILTTSIYAYYQGIPSGTQVIPSVSGASGLFTQVNSSATNIQVPAGAGLVPSTLVDSASGLRTLLSPKGHITKRVASRLNIPVSNPYILPGNQVANQINAVMAYPAIQECMYTPLVNLSQEYIVPNLGQYPNNLITLLKSDNKFIESYMVGLNHEMAKELLWREYPTDQRGSYFRQFWDVLDSSNGTGGTFTYDPDITEIATWGNNALGTNETGRLGGVNAKISLLIRGDLLKKYPNTVIYAQKAVFSPSNQTVTKGLSDNTVASNIMFPVFKAELQPDVTVLSFDLDIPTAQGNATNPGWFFVLRERPGHIRFALEAGSGTATSSIPPSWEQLSWDYMLPYSTVHISNGTATTVIQQYNPGVYNANHPGQYNPTSEDAQVTWDSTKLNSAAMAYILYMDPMLVAIHAESMLPGVTTGGGTVITGGGNQIGGGITLGGGSGGSI